MGFLSKVKSNIANIGNKIPIGGGLASNAAQGAVPPIGGGLASKVANIGNKMPIGGGLASNAAQGAVNFNNELQQADGMFGGGGSPLQQNASKIISTFRK